jgi:hypothetical protein
MIRLLPSIAIDLFLFSILSLSILPFSPFNILPLILVIAITLYRMFKAMHAQTYKIHEWPPPNQEAPLGHQKQGFQRGLFRV